MLEEKRNKAIVIDEFPNRKKLCLGILDGNKESKVATFNNDYSAWVVIKIISEMLGIPIDEKVDLFFMRRMEDCTEWSENEKQL